MPKKCKRADCPKPRKPERKDGFCSARCKKYVRQGDYLLWRGIGDRPCDPDHGWF